MSDRERVSAVIDDRMTAYRDALDELLRQPSISATGDGMEAASHLVAETLERFGLETERIETGRYPLVYAEHNPEPGETTTATPTIVFYGHYDVQPPGDPDAWDSPPFEPTVREQSIYARGVGDNKGQFLCHAAAVDALTEADAFPDLTVKLLIEGGEESGSAGLREYLNGSPTEIDDADLVYVADGPQHAVMEGDSEETGDRTRRDRPTLIYGNRGLLSFQLDLRTANTDLHSGNFGGPVPVATNELVSAITSMWDGDEIAVEGFHDGIDISAADRELCARIPDDSAAIVDELDLPGLATDDPYYERLLLEPTMTINGLDGGYQGEGMKTVLPSTATAKLDCRLVPGQDPDAVFDAILTHLEAETAAIRVEKLGSFPPMKTPVDAPEAEPLLDALETVWDEEPIELPVLGGSLPAAYFRTVDSLASVPIFVVPYANHDQGNHSPNEHLDERCFENGVRTSVRVLQEVARTL